MKRKIREAIVVEGRYDKNAVSQAVDALILETEGFGIFSDREKLKLIRAVAQKRGVILLTDPDSAGFLIRNHLKGALAGVCVKEAYIPDIPGKERRKAAPSREGKLGVEGVPPEVILEALLRAGATFEDENSAPEVRGALTKADFLELGLTGPGSRARRAALLKALDLPERLTANALLDVLNILMDKTELISLLSSLRPR